LAPLLAVAGLSVSFLFASPVSAAAFADYQAFGDSYTGVKVVDTCGGVVTVVDGVATCRVSLVPVAFGDPVAKISDVVMYLGLDYRYMFRYTMYRDDVQVYTTGWAYADDFQGTMGHSYNNPDLALLACDDGLSYSVDVALDGNDPENIVNTSIQSLVEWSPDDFTCDSGGGGSVVADYGKFDTEESRWFWSLCIGLVLFACWVVVVTFKSILDYRGHLNGS